ncbi:MAG TPA: amidohydrolase family protein [Thermoanaerobaculia bacterium]|nr:amidohydrolase family protein [Thermoanaerobaculia bacterium]
MLRKVGGFVAAVLVAAWLEGAEPETIVLKAARMFDGRGETVSSPAVVVVKGSRIEAVGSDLPAPAGARIIDLGDATLLPGFIDAHVHLTGESSDNWFRDFFQNVMRFPAEQAHYAALYAKRTLQAGFTTVRNVGADDYLDLGLRNAINAGIAEGPRMLIAIHAIGSTGGHGDGSPIPPDRRTPRGPIQGVCNGADECRAAVRYQIKYGADVIKCMPSGGVLSLGDPVDAPEMTQEEVNAIVEEAHHWGRKVAAHIHGDEAGRVAIKAGVDSIEHGSFLKPETLAQMKAKGIYLVPTLLAGETVVAQASKFPPAIAAKGRAAVAARTDMFRNALKGGVKIAFGTDSAVSIHGTNAQEFALMVGLGMPPAAALKSATASGADLLGLAKEIGTIEKGKSADLVAVPGNPLSDIKETEKVFFVMKEGKVVRNSR